MMRRICLVIVVTTAVAVPASVFAQAGYTAGGAGSPDLAPAPRTPYGTPDLSGLWNPPHRVSPEGRAFYGRLEPAPQEEPEVTPWGYERWLVNDDPREGFGAREHLDPAYARCVPRGTALLISGWGSTSPMEIIQSPERVLIIYEKGPQIRQIWMDGRAHPEPLELTFVGHSIGRWDGDTLVVETVGMRNEPWLTNRGYMHSTDLRITERYRRLDSEALQIDVTFEDPKALAKPFHRRFYRKLYPDWDLQEDAWCYEGSEERSAQQGVWEIEYTEQ